MADCGCANCGHRFRGLTLFDRHQDVDYSRVPAVECKSPDSLGLVQDETGTWCTREGLAQRQALTERMVTARSARDANRVKA